ncbi:hypothetical protein BLNAU_18616 [Blattamonas nauphoetae]|uniref:Uncharacterized protein n=1 Tax=Blattamonas nauphoetae TaxID=2049346 RepID=A0ABQ9X737_9EUKA|nr:hypothetical protein BLNAU_18616 [Blattamonas nauphoetae]
MENPLTKETVTYCEEHIAPIEAGDSSDHILLFFVRVTGASILFFFVTTKNEEAGARIIATSLCPKEIKVDPNVDDRLVLDDNLEDTNNCRQQQLPCSDVGSPQHQPSVFAHASLAPLHAPRAPLATAHSPHAPLATAHSPRAPLGQLTLHMLPSQQLTLHVLPSQQLTLHMLPSQQLTLHMLPSPHLTLFTSFHILTHEKTCRFNPEKRTQTPTEPRRHSRNSEGQKVAAKAKKPTEKPIIIHDDDSS